MSTPTREKIKHFKVTINGRPLDNDMKRQLVEIEVSLAFNMPGMFSFRFEDSELEILKQQKIALGDEIEISFPKQDDNDTMEVVFFGEVTAIEPTYEAGFRTILNVRGYDFMHRLSHGTYIRTFQNIKDSDIVSTMAGEAGLTATSEATTTVYDHLFQYNQTNLAFLRQLARRNNYKFWVDKDKKLHFKKAATTTGAVVTLNWGVELLGFFPRLSLAEQITNVTVRGWDVKTKKAVVGTSATAKYLQEIGAEQKGGSAYKSATAKDAKHYEVMHTTFTQSQANELAQSILDDHNATYIEAEGLCKGDARLVPGSKIRIQQVNTDFEGTYKLTTVRHIFNQDGFKTEFTIDGMRPKFMSDLLGVATASDLTNQKVNGVVPAIVTQNVDPDNLHRVRVKYPWLSDDEESCWARVATPDAGPQRGMTFLPEVNDEVLVAFAHGDIGRPYVVGRVWNGRDSVPHTANEIVKDGKVNLRVIKTRAGHVLTFDDTADTELISLVDKTGKNLIKIESSTNLITIDAKGGKVLLKMDGENGKMTITTKDTFDVTADGNMTLTTKGDMTLKATGNMNIEGNNVNVKAKASAEVKASASVTVKGSASGTFDGGGSTTIKGGTVAIN